MTRAKFTCQSITKYAGTVGEQIELQATIRHDDKDNEQWSKWTPSGSLKMLITNEALFGRFVPGHDYYLDISEVK